MSQCTKKDFKPLRFEAVSTYECAVYTKFLWAASKK